MPYLVALIFGAVLGTIAGFGFRLMESQSFGAPGVSLIFLAAVSYTTALVLMRFI